MSWGRLDDDLWHHPKVSELEKHGPQVFAQAMSTWVLANSYCRKFASETGAISLKQLRRILPYSPVRAVKALVAVELWIEAPEGYRFKDWEDYLPNKSTNKSPKKSATSHPTSREQVPQQVGNKSGKESVSHIAKPLRKRPIPEPEPDPTTTSSIEQVVGSARAAPFQPSEHPSFESVEDDRRAAVRAIRQEYISLYREHTERRGTPRDPHLPPQEAFLHSAAHYVARLHHDEPDEAKRHEAIDADCRRAVRNFMAAKRKTRSPQLEWLNERLESYLDGKPKTKREVTRKRDNRKLDGELKAREAESVDPEEARRLAAEAIGAVVGRSKGMFPKKHPDVKRAERNDESRRQRDALREVGS